MIEGSQIYLRALEEEDLPLRVKWVNNPKIRQYLMFDYPLSLAKTKQWFHKTLFDNSKYNFSIVDKESGRTIGMTGLIDVDIKNRRGQFYLTIGEEDFWGKKLSDEAIQMVLWYGFVELNLNKVYGMALNNNEKIHHVLQRNGYKTEGVLREHFYCVGEWQDIMPLSVLKSEWQKSEKKFVPKF